MTLARQPRVLLIGPVPPRSPSETNPVGGTAVHFQETIRELSERAVIPVIIDTTRHRMNMRGTVFAMHAVAKVIKVLLSALHRTRSCDVVFLNLTAGRISLLGPLIWVICALFCRPMILRLFGGEFADTYDGYSAFVRWLADHTFMRCARIYVQTRAIAKKFGHHSSVRWFPNTRDVQVSRNRTPVAAKKLLFVAQLRNEKGLREALEACQGLPDRCHLSVYGPRIDDFNIDLIAGYSNASYEGVLHPQDVPAVITAHDVILLPTYFRSEGYPGVLIESFQCGRPVISTWWKSIPEIVEHRQNGLLVAPRSARELRTAILQLVDNSDLYRTLCIGARQSGECFRSSLWYDRLAEDIASVVDIPGGSP